MGRRTQRLNTLIETIKNSFIPWDWLSDMYDLRQSQAPGFLRQAAEVTLRRIWHATERAIFPALAIEYKSPSQEQRWERFSALPVRLRILSFFFILMYGPAVRLIDPMAPKAEPIATIIGFCLLATAGCTLYLHRSGLFLTGRRPPAFINPESARKWLVSIADRLLLDDTTPEHFLRVISIAATFGMLFVFPSWAVAQRFQKNPFIEHVSWIRIAAAFAVCTAMAVWFRCIFKSSRLALKAIQNEIAAIDRGERRVRGRTRA
jgi:hypothetical protein